MIVTIIYNASDDSVFPILTDTQEEAQQALLNFAKTHWDILEDSLQVPTSVEGIIEKFFGEKNSGYQYTIFHDVASGSNCIPSSERPGWKNTSLDDDTFAEDWATARPHASYNDPNCDHDGPPVISYPYTEENRWSDHTSDSMAILKFWANLNLGRVDTSGIEYTQFIADMASLDFDLSHAAEHLRAGIASKLLSGSFRFAKDEGGAGEHKDSSPDSKEADCRLSDSPRRRHSQR